MSLQLNIDFTSGSKLNTLKLSGQNRRLFDWLSSGNTITMLEAGKIGIGYLNSRISDLRNKVGVVIYDRMVDRCGTKVKEYSMNPFKKK